MQQISKEKPNTIKRKSFKDLIIWQKADLIFKMVAKDVRKFPYTRIAKSLIDQLLRSAGSISANIAEGYGRGGAGEFKQFLRYARGSAEETLSWLIKVCDQKLISNQRLLEYESLFEELAKMTNSFIGKLNKQRRKQ